ncbi:MAG: MFS transporter [Devosia sp.]|uniref:MFS transporter n=1 Tax=Devosia sp. TaxID=1871048 RepID=UPI001AC0FF37|nr:MFS transporter [Devosia sp.]MBN9317889.1 MFS transporter [Devosia sp.]
MNNGTDEPAMPARRKLHPGWLVMLAGLVATFMTTPGQTVGVAPFIDHIASDLALTRNEVLTYYSLGTLFGVLPAPFIGRLADRFGPRRVITFAVVAVSAACLAMALVQGPVTLAAAFTFLRGSATGGLGLVSGQMINLWFVRYRGRANAVSMLGLALGGLIIPGLSEQITAAFGWRVSYMVLGAGVLAIMLPIGLLFFRNHPSAYKSTPDFGRTPDDKAPVISGSLTVSEALRAPMMWYFLDVAVVLNAVGTALVLDHLRLLDAEGIDRSAAISLLGIVPMMQVIAVIGGGLLIDRLGTRATGLIGLAINGLAIVCVVARPDLLGGAAYVALLGLSLGTLQVVQGAAMAEHFGMRAMGALRGIVFVVGAFGAAAGPLIFAVWSPETGYAAFLTLVGVAALLGIFSPAPHAARNR